MGQSKALSDMLRSARKAAGIKAPEDRVPELERNLELAKRDRDALVRELDSARANLEETVKRCNALSSEAQRLTLELEATSRELETTRKELEAHAGKGKR